MAGLAETMLQGAIESTAPNAGPDIIGSYTKGAELAVHQEKIQQAMAANAQKQQDLKLAKFEKIGGWLETYAKMPEGGMKKTFGEDFIPNGIAGIGMDKEFHPLVQKMIVKEPQLGAFIVNEVKSGNLSVSALNDPEQIAGLADKYKQFGGIEAIKNARDEQAGKLEEAAKFAMGEEGKDYRAKIMAQEQMKRAEYAAAEQSQRGVEEAARAGSKEADVAFAKNEYVPYQAAGGKAAIDAQISALKGAKQTLETGPELGGRISTAIPGLKSEAAQDILNPDTAAIQRKVFKAIGAGLRQTLGSAFTEEEGLRIQHQTFNPRLSNKENIVSIDGAIKQLEQQAATKEASIKYFRQNGGSLKGMPAPVVEAPAPQTAPQAATSDTILVKGKSWPMSKVRSAYKQNGDAFLEVLSEDTGISKAELKKRLGGK